MLKKLFLLIIVCFGLINLSGYDLNVFATNTGNISSTGFIVDTDDFALGGSKIKVEGSSTQTINKLLGTIIQKLMIALGIISLLAMTIGAGYMIFAHGEDEYLSKGKNIFIAGIMALVVALSSYYIVNLVSYIFYK